MVLKRKKGSRELATARAHKSREVDWTEIEWLEARLEGAWLFIQTTIVIALHVAAGRTEIEGGYLWEAGESGWKGEWRSDGPVLLRLDLRGVQKLNTSFMSIIFLSRICIPNTMSTKLL